MEQESRKIKWTNHVKWFKVIFLSFSIQNEFIMTTDHTKEITDLLTKYKSILIDDLLSNKSVLQLLVEETIIDKNDLEFLLQTDESESENELNDKKCQYLIDIISKDGLKCFKKFCYTIESDCKMLITALINDSLNYGKFCSILIPR